VGRSGGGSARPQPGVAHRALDNASHGAPREQPGSESTFSGLFDRHLVCDAVSGATSKARAEARRSR
jgi:hypothetical protein